MSHTTKSSSFSIHRRVQLVVICLCFGLIGLVPQSITKNVAGNEPVNNNNKVSRALVPESIPSQTIQNNYIQASTSAGGRFVIGTTGGDPNISSDDTKRLLYGYPTNIGSSFSTLRVGNGTSMNDYRLGNTDWTATGISPTIPPTSNSTTITTVWERDGIRVQEKIAFAQNPETGRLDTTSIQYNLTNFTTTPRSAGLRVMLDVQVGNNDGAPYFIDGVGQLTQQFEWIGANVPDYWRAYESPTFASNSLQSRGQLSGNNATRPDRFVVADWPQAQETVWNYTINPNDSIQNDSATLLYYNPITLAPNQTKTYITYYGIANSDSAPQLQLEGLEVIQVIQNWENSVVLIQDKPTIVRAHVRSTSGTVNDVTAELIGTRNGSPLPESPLPASNLGRTVDILENPQRNQLEQSFYFELPRDWRNGTVDLEFRGVNHTIFCREHANTDNDCKAQVKFVKSPTPEVRLVGLIWKDSVLHYPIDEDFIELVELIESAFPINQLGWDNPYDIKPVFFAGQPNTILHFRRLNLMLAINKALDKCDTHTCKDYYIGVLVDPPSQGVMGLSNGKVTSGYNTENILLHEFGHSLGRKHTLCNGKESGSDTLYPYNEGKISSYKIGDLAFYGFDTSIKKIYTPDAGDLMSYCIPIWPSDYTYNGIRNSLINQYGNPTINAAQQTAQDVLLISGSVSLTDGTGTFESIYSIDAPVSPPASGSFAIRFENSSGQDIGTYNFEPDRGSEGSTGSFVLLLPRIDATARVVLLHNGQQLDVRTVSAHAPTVTALTPNGGENLSSSTGTISWSANDPDGDSLSYVVQYSKDGGANWDTIGVDLSTTSLDIDWNQLAGTSQGLIRVLASDGFHTAQDQSDAVFSVGRHVPEPYITTPDTNSVYVEDQVIILEGRAYDQEDGELANTELSWSSDLNGQLGTGASLAINALNLTEGIHTITLTAKDSDGQVGKTNINIQIYRTRPIFPASLALAPASIHFIATEGSQQTTSQLLSIHNAGDNTLTWSANADTDWIRLSSLNGTAPTNIIIAPDVSDLPIGEYTGNITVTGYGATNTPQIIQVTLSIIPPVKTHLPLVLAPGNGTTPPTITPIPPTQVTPPTGIPSNTPTWTATATNTPTNTNTPTDTPTNTPTDTPTWTIPPSITPSDTPTHTPTDTPVPQPSTTTRVSVASDGTQANLGSYAPAISADGRFVAYQSYASNLVANDTNSFPEMFLHDRTTKITTRISVASDGTQADGISYDPSLSADGRYIVFESIATNLISNDTNGASDIYLHDRVNRTTTRVSLTASGGEPNGGSFDPVITLDGRYIVYGSDATNIVSNDTNGHSDLFLYDRLTNTTTKLTYGFDGSPTNGSSFHAALSGDGSYITFDSDATNLVNDDTNLVKDVFVYDRQTHTTTRVSRTTDGFEANGTSSDPAISDDGRFITYASDATNIVANDTNTLTDVFIYDRILNTTNRISLDAFGNQANARSFDPMISGNGRYITFDSAATNLIPDDTNGYNDIFMFDRLTNGMSRVSLRANGLQSDGHSANHAINSDGRFITFESTATFLVSNDTNGRSDIFVRDRGINN